LSSQLIALVRLLYVA